MHLCLLGARLRPGNAERGVFAAFWNNPAMIIDGEGGVGEFLLFTSREYSEIMSVMVGT